MEESKNKGGVRVNFPDMKVFRQDASLGARSKDVRDVVLQERVIVTPNRVFNFEYADYPESGGIYRHFTGCIYPAATFPFPTSIHAINMVKRYLLGHFRLLSKSKTMLFTFVTSKRFRNEFFRTFNESANLTLSPIYYEDRYYADPCKQVRAFLETFLGELGVDEQNSFLFSLIVETIFEHDNAYRHPLQDLAGETTKERMMADFPAELNNLYRIYGSRMHAENPEGNDFMKNKISPLMKFLKAIWMVPAFRSAIRKGIGAMDWSMLVMSKGEKYHTLINADYNYGGIPFRDRLKRFIEMHPDGKTPPMIEYWPQGMAPPQ